MNPIRYLENRIRGWLPKEPNLPKQPTPNSQKTADNQTLIPPQTGNLPTKTGSRASLLYALCGFIWSLLALQQILRSFAYPYFFPWQLTLLVVAAGCIFGVAFGGAVARWQLRTLSTKGEIKPLPKISVLIIVIGSILILGGVLLYFLPEMSLQNPPMLFIDFVASMVPAVWFTGFAFFSSWERKYKRTILSGLWGGLYVVSTMDNTQVKSRTQ
jgi:fluoride ion exporter CrcB/FEX